MKHVFGTGGPNSTCPPPTPHPLSKVVPEAAEFRLEIGDLGLVHDLTGSLKPCLKPREGKGLAQDHAAGRWGLDLAVWFQLPILGFGDNRELLCQCRSLSEMPAAQRVAAGSLPTGS